ncbi:MAG TPA: hypothetical protein VM864_14635 [Pyrinomonadaceae bacterium]|jgi:hypothetical protein|nr:hypothetical protein [Pyrinomonadaceae bacterium]
MTPRVLQRRSSLPSSFLTGLIGWVGFMVIVGMIIKLAFGDAPPAGWLLFVGALAAVAQVSILRAAFFPLGLDRGARAGLVWGGATGGAIIAVALYLSPTLRRHYVIWSLDGIYIGVAVGLFLAYFYRDDRRIETGAADGPVDYGRDAHWLEPFAFGAVAYLLAFAPRSADVAATAFVVGAMSGVVAAGVSHFFLNSVWSASALPVVLSAAAGAAQGALSGLLFRPYQDELFLHRVAHSAIAGALAYFLTALRGKSLARTEAGVGYVAGEAN